MVGGLWGLTWLGSLVSWASHGWDLWSLGPHMAGISRFLGLTWLGSGLLGLTWLGSGLLGLTWLGSVMHLPFLTHTRDSAHTSAKAQATQVCVHVCMYVCVCMYMCVRMYIYPGICVKPTARPDAYGCFVPPLGSRLAANWPGRQTRFCFSSSVSDSRLG